MSLLATFKLNSPLITHLTGENNYVWVHYQDGRRILYSRPLVYCEGVFAAFIRVHKTALINPRFVSKWDLPGNQRDNGLVTLQGGICLPVSRRRLNSIRLQTALADQAALPTRGRLSEWVGQPSGPGTTLFM